MHVVLIILGYTVCAEIFTLRNSREFRESVGIRKNSILQKTAASNVLSSLVIV